MMLNTHGGRAYLLMGPKMPHNEIAGGLSRRQMLRRGVAVGTAAWTVPTVTAITLTPANAASPSGQPSEPPKPPTKPPELPTDKPTPGEPSQPPGKPSPTQPPGEEPTAPPGQHPTPRPTPSRGTPDDDDTTVGAGQLPDTGPGDVARTVALGGLLAAGGAAAVAASRRPTDDTDAAAPEATA